MLTVFESILFSIWVLIRAQVAPNGLVFVKHHIRQGVLGRMLGELLETRFMLKKAMKTHKHDKVCLIRE
jgi:DNA polymerase elongation subunit (family B)